MPRQPGIKENRPRREGGGRKPSPNPGKSLRVYLSGPVSDYVNARAAEAGLTPNLYVARLAEAAAGITKKDEKEPTQ